MSSSGKSWSTAFRSRVLFAPNGAIGTSSCGRAENFISPIRSCGAALAKKPRSPDFACSSLFSSPIEPELSSTSSTFAGLRSRRQVVSTLSSTFGSGTFSSIFGCDGSAPLAVETIPAGFALSEPGLKPN